MLFIFYPPSSWGLSVFTAPGKGLTSCRWDLGELRVETPWRVKVIHSLSLLGISDSSLSLSLMEEGDQTSPWERFRGGRGRRECIANKFGNQMRSELPTHSLKSLYSLSFKILVF